MSELHSNSLNHIDSFILDEDQGAVIRAIGYGTRIIYGTSGSGKTLVLMTIAKRLLCQKKAETLLFLCNNPAVRSIISQDLAGTGSDICTFHEWAKSYNIPITDHLGLKDADEIGTDMLGVSILNHTNKKYDAVLVDELQDFVPSWVEAAGMAVKDMRTGFFILASDKNQAGYLWDTFSWSSIGIHAPGNTLYLRKNYRNTREIMQVAELYEVYNPSSDEDLFGVVLAHPEQCTKTGMKPILYWCKDRRKECQIAAALVRMMVQPKEDGFFSQTPIKPEEIGILYPIFTRNQRKYLKEMEDEINQFSHAFWNENEKESEVEPVIILPDQPSVMIQSIASAKGVEYRAVILLFSEQRDFDDLFDDDRILMYTGITRAKEFLWILHTEMRWLIEPLYSTKRITRKCAFS